VTTSLALRWRTTHRSWKVVCVKSSALLKLAVTDEAHLEALVRAGRRISRVAAGTRRVALRLQGEFLGAYRA
jgi:hypothetical protein